MKKLKGIYLLYLNAGLLAAALNTVFDILQFHTLLNWTIFVVYSSLFVLSSGKIRTVFQKGAEDSFTQTNHDKLKKRIINLSYLIVYLLAILLINFYIAVISSTGKLSEMLSSVRLSYGWLTFAFFFWYAGILRLHAVCTKDELAACRRYFLRQFVITGSAWLLYLIVGFCVGIRFIYGTFFYASIVCLVYVLICNITIRKQIVDVNFQWKKRYTITIVSTLTVILAVSYMRRDTYYLQGYINQLPRLKQNTVPIEYREEDGVYELHMESDQFKILQLTDIHLGGSISSIRKDKLALEAVYQVIAYTEPDFVIVTGDMTFPLGIMSMSLNNSSTVSQFAAFMRNLNIPWAFTFGNHDTELIASMDRNGLCDLYKSLSFRTSGTLLFPYVQPDISGRNNQVIELYNQDGSLNTALFLIDSNAYTGNGINDYDFIHDDQVAWYSLEVNRLKNAAGRVIPSMAFFHIPLQEYRDAYVMYMAGDEGVTYFFGSNDEEAIDKICCSDYSSSFFDTAVALESTKAMFCGHDHYNNMSLEYRGVRLTYGMSIDYLAMPGIEKSEKQRGGTLITIYENSSFDIEQIPLIVIPK